MRNISNYAKYVLLNKIRYFKSEGSDLIVCIKGGVESLNTRKKNSVNLIHINIAMKMN